jgi:hypothetical protein
MTRLLNPLDGYEINYMRRYAKSGPNLSRPGNRAYSGCGLSYVKEKKRNMCRVYVLTRQEKPYVTKTTRAWVIGRPSA